MPMDLSKIRLSKRKRSRLITPDDIFNSLTLRGDVEGIWATQAEALREWHQHRHESDVSIEMSTGGGKTLVGLLVAQSIVNETEGKVLYVCPTNQLVEQTVGKARECGIDVVTYMQGNWSGDAYHACRGACVTNYAAVFNSHTIFREEDLEGIVFDDAHVAHNVIRSQFTLRISSNHPAFRQLVNLFRAHFGRNFQSQQFQDAIGGDWGALLFVPMFEVTRNSGAIAKILLQNGVLDAPETSFPWGHLKDSLTKCAFLISGGRIEITPPILPLHALPYFSEAVRRVYLTATMPSQVEFARTFGVAETVQIAPHGKSGEAQRLFIFVGGNTDQEQREHACDLVAEEKACVIVPSAQAADCWPIGERFDGRRGHRQIEAFASTDAPAKLILAARYDGIDLPGAACRVLILDGSPIGGFLIDRFMDQGLRIEGLRLSHRATRIVQAIGRIFRSNRDHGAVLVCGVTLQRWLLDPNHRRYMPDLLQRQVQLGIELQRLAGNGEVDFAELLDGVLQGRSDWDALYTRHIDAFDALPLPEEVDWFTDLVVRERATFDRFWEGDFPVAAQAYRDLAEAATLRDQRLAAWYWHWNGVALDLGGQDEAASSAYFRAASKRSELGWPRVEAGKLVPAEDVAPSHQASMIAQTIRRGKGRLVTRMKQVRGDLAYGGETSRAEEALCELGRLLGLEASRPDHEQRTGPDVLWRYQPDCAGIAMDAKTDKDPNGSYRKTADIGQFHDHDQWLSDSYPDESFLKAIVGKLLKVTPAANPPPDLQVIPLEQFEGLLNRFHELLEFIEARGDREDVDVCVERALRLYGLSWPNCATSLEGRLAVDLQGEQEMPQDEET